MLNNLPEDVCKCGHSFKLHDMPKSASVATGVCWYAGHVAGHHPCTEFVLNNLSWVAKHAKA